MHLIERVWRSDDTLSRAARLALIPFEGAFRAVTATRGWMYDHALLRSSESRIPTVSIGNLSVGGTGKTPFAAWVASELSRRGARPAVVLRGYGGDEPLVHARLNPAIPVIIEGGRAVGIRRAAELGATVAVLDDAFQHRAAARAADIVLIAAEQWGRSVRVLPAGPWREPLSALRRASLAVITHKRMKDARVDELALAIQKAAPHVPQAVVRFSLGELRSVGSAGESQALALERLEGAPVVAIAGVADPAAFFQQLSDAGAEVISYPFKDHHRFTADDIHSVLDKVPNSRTIVVCTLKDAVKLAPLWPASAPPLWYVSQALEVESGEEALEKLLSQLVPAHRSIR